MFIEGPFQFYFHVSGVVNDSRVCGEQPMDNVLERQGRFDIPGYCVYVVVREVCADLHEPLNVIRSGILTFSRLTFPFFVFSFICFLLHICSKPLSSIYL